MNGSDVGEYHRVREGILLAQPGISHALHLGGIPSHDQVCKQGKGAGYRSHLILATTLIGAHSSWIDRPLQVVNRFPIIKVPYTSRRKDELLSKSQR